ncbi:MAG: restriction endonuclease subunit R, partial [Bacteroidetes bacterium]
MQLLSITYPTPQFKTKIVAGVTQIWDSWRKKWIVLTPEEWVRQNFIAYLTQV